MLMVKQGGDMEVDVAREGDAQVEITLKKRERGEEDAVQNTRCSNAEKEEVTLGDGDLTMEDETSPGVEETDKKRARVERDSLIDDSDNALKSVNTESPEEGILEAYVLKGLELPTSKTTLEDGVEAIEKANIKTEAGHGIDKEEMIEDRPAIETSKKVEKGTNIPGGGRPGKKRKVAMLLAYCGAGYQGMQRNPGAITIEGDLEQALFRAEAISQCNFGDLRKVDWMRAARTDKGVSAVGQVVSGRLIIDPPGFVERVNKHLPKEIRILGYKRATHNFNARQMCDRRRYEYIIPVFAFDPNAHHDRETVLAWTEKREAEKRERAKKAMEKKDADSGKESGQVGGLVPEQLLTVVSEGEEKSGSSPNGVEGDVAKGVTKTSAQIVTDGYSLPKLFTEAGMEIVGHSEGQLFASPQAKGEIDPIKKDQEVSIPLEGTSNSFAETVEDSNDPTNVEDNADTPSEEITENTKFTFGEEELKRMNSILGKYVGTHNFHNFTARMKAEDPSAKRYILSFEAHEIIEVAGMQFVRCTVLGQSFMLHQIRKMIGMAIAIMRGCAPDSIIDTALRRDTNVNVPMAPELGLFLDECIYSAYNTKFMETHEEVSQKGHEEEISEFKRNVIYSHIASTEAKDGTMAMWLHSLNDRNYPDFVVAREEVKSAVGWALHYALASLPLFAISQAARDNHP